MTCPDCNGAGLVVMHCVGRMSGSNRSGLGTYSCSRCRGNGNVPDAMAEWIRRGEAMRAKRLAANRSGREEAARRGMTPKELCDMEMGRCEPKEES